MISNQSVGARAIAAHAAMQAPWATLQARTAAGAPTPAVTVPVNPKHPHQY